MARNGWQLARWTLGFILILVLSFALASAAFAEVARVEITERVLFADGKSFGNVGQYERIKGKLHYAVDVNNPYNKQIVDLELAPRNEDGEVEFSGDFILLKPVDLSKGNHRLLYEVNNRGRLLALGYYNDALLTNDPITEADAGNGFLMREGYSILWSGWNWDVMPGDNRLQIP